MIAFAYSPIEQTREIYRVFKHTLEPGITQDRGTLEWSHGCNGKQHVDILTKLFVNGEGVIEWAEEVVKVERGPCDGTCNTNSDDEGFLYP